MYNFNANPIARHPRTAQSPRLGRVLLRQIVVPGDSPLNLFRTIALAHSPAGREFQRERQRQCRAMQTSVTMHSNALSNLLASWTNRWPIPPDRHPPPPLSSLDPQLPVSASLQLIGFQMEKAAFNLNQGPQTFARTLRMNSVRRTKGLSTLHALLMYESRRPSGKSWSFTQ